MRKRGLVISFNDQKYFLLIVNDEVIYFIDNRKDYDLIKPHQIFDYFDTGSDSQKINILKCHSLRLMEVDSVKIQQNCELEMWLCREKPHLHNPETLKWLAKEGVDFHTDGQILLTWGKRQGHTELVNYFEKIAPPKAAKISLLIKEMIVRDFCEIINDSDSNLTIEQRQTIICFLIEVIHKKQLSSLTETVLDTLGKVIEYDFTSEQIEPIIDFMMETVKKGFVVETPIHILMKLHTKSYLSEKQKQSIIDLLIGIVCP